MTRSVRGTHFKKKSATPHRRRISFTISFARDIILHTDNIMQSSEENSYANTLSIVSSRLIRYFSWKIKFMTSFPPVSRTLILKLSRQPVLYEILLASFRAEN